MQIDVDDTSFQAFNESFTRYREAVRALPGAWANVNREAEHTANLFSDISAALMAHGELMARARYGVDQFAHSTNRAVTGWQRVSRFTSEVASNVVRVTGQLLRWTGIATALGGLAGFGSLMGIDRLAGSTSDYRRQALGLGASIGETRAFGTAFERFVDPGRFLGGVAEMLGDPSRRWGLYGAGMTERQLQSGNTAQIAVAMLPQIQRLLQQTNPALLAPRLESLGLGGIMSVEDARRLRAMTPQELQNQIRLYNQARLQLQINDQLARKWQDLSTQLTLSRQTIETALIDGLQGLVPGLQNLSRAFAGVISAFAKSPVAKEVIDQIGHGLDRFAGYLNSPQFKTDFDNFEKSVGALGSAIGTAASAVASFATSVVSGVNFIASKLPQEAQPGFKSGLVGAGAGALLGGRLFGLPGAVLGGGIGYLIGHDAADPKLKPAGPLQQQITALTPPAGQESVLGPSDIHKNLDWWRRGLENTAQAIAPQIRAMTPPPGQENVLRQPPPAHEEVSWWQRILHELQMPSWFREQKEKLEEIVSAIKSLAMGGQRQPVLVPGGALKPGSAVPGLAGPGPGLTSNEWAKLGLSRDAFLDITEQLESGGRNLWNYKHDLAPNYFTAGGRWQQLDSNWRKYGGVYADIWPHAIDAPRWAQREAAGRQYDVEGDPPWSNSNAKLNRWLRDFQSSARTRSRDQNRTPSFDLNINNNTGGATFVTGGALSAGY